MEIISCQTDERSDAQYQQFGRKEDRFMSKGTRIRTMRKERTDRKHTVVSKKTRPSEMNNPANAIKAKEISRQKKRVS